MTNILLGLPVETIAAVPLSLARKYVRLGVTARYDTIFKKYGSGGKGVSASNKSRIYIPLGGRPEANDIDIPEEISTYLSKENMTVVDYRAGIVSLPDGKRMGRMGRALSSQPELLKKFTNDPQRSAVKAAPAWVVISRHPYDIVGMSFDRGWTSCMDAKEGENKRYLIQDVKKGSLVAYLIKENDRNINSPLARILLKPYISGEGKGKASDRSQILVPGPVYGTAPPSFSKICKIFARWANSGEPDGYYTLVEGLYPDDSVRDLYHHGDDNLVIEPPKSNSDAEDFNIKTETLAQSPLTAQPVLMQIAKLGGVSSLTLLAENPHADKEILQTIIDRSKEIPNGERALESLGDNKNVTSDLLRQLFELGEHNGLAGNPKTPQDVLEKLFAAYRVTRARILENPNCPDSLFRLVATKSSFDDYILDVLDHPNLSPEILELLLVRKYSDLGTKLDVWQQVWQRRNLPKDRWVPLQKQIIAEDPGYLTDLSYSMFVNGHGLKNIPEEIFETALKSPDKQVQNTIKRYMEEKKALEK